jgi:hypothetical protein
MKKVSFRTIKFLILGLFLLMQVWLLFLKKHDTMDINVSPGTNPAIDIWGGTRLAQSFVSRLNGLARIDVSLATHDRSNSKDVVFELREADPGSTAFVRLIFNAATVQNNAFRAFTFPPQPHSARKKYIFSLSSPDSNPSDAICVWMNRRDIYEDGNFIINGRPQEGDLSFRVYSRRTIMSELHRIVRNYPGIFHSTTLLIAAIVLFTLAEILVLVKLLDIIYSTLKGMETVSGPPE